MLKVIKGFAIFCVFLTTTAILKHPFLGIIATVGFCYAYSKLSVGEEIL